LSAATARVALEASYRTEARHVRATLVRVLGGLDEAEEALHEAFTAAAERWPLSGVPANPYGWLVSAGRFKTVDRWRRQARVDSALPELARLIEAEAEWDMPEPEAIEDDQLRLIFTCCHPSLALDARIALTLREVGGLTTEEIAGAYLAPAPTIGQRIVRAKAKIREAAIPYAAPSPAELPVRLAGVLHVVYLIFNEGYAATEGPELTRADLCAEATRLGRLVVELLPEPEALGLLALMLLHEARRAARVDASGDLVLLEDQDRSRWDRQRIAEARNLVEPSLIAGRLGPYGLQAAIGLTHAVAPCFGETDWVQIVGLYDLLQCVAPSPVVALNRAAAVGMRDGPNAGLAAVEAVLEAGGLDDYLWAHAARAEMQRRLGLDEAARAAYQRALALTQQGSERRFLEMRLRQLAG
jgi:RNA polymerase sigma-70 factor, ECF subfamily